MGRIEVGTKRQLTDRCLPFVMDLVDVFVESFVVEETVAVVEEDLDCEKEDGEVQEDRGEGRHIQGVEDGGIQEGIEEDSRQWPEDEEIRQNPPQTGHVLIHRGLNSVYTKEEMSLTSFSSCILYSSAHFGWKMSNKIKGVLTMMYQAMEISDPPTILQNGRIYFE